METKRKVALLTVIIILLNLFSPYISIFNNTVFAATGVLEENPLILNNLGITQKGNNRILKVEIALVSEAVINGFDLQFKVDPNKLTPCNRNTGSATSSLPMIMSQSDYYAGTLQIKTYDSSTNTFHFTATEQAGGFDIAENGYIPGEVGDPAIDENGDGYPVYYPVLTLSFKVMDDSITEDNITLDMFELVPITVGLPTGLKVNYNNTEGIRVSKDVTLGGKGFALPEKEIESISVKTNPNNTTYNHGDNIDLTGGEITVTYKDKSTEDISMTDPEVSILSGSPANVKNNTVTLSYKGKTTSFNITVNDPITSFTVSKPMEKLEYEHGDNFDFTGLELTVTKQSGATEKLTKDSEGVTVSETQANVDSDNFTKTSGEGVVPVKGTQKIIFSYSGKTATQTVVVNDTIQSIKLTSQPSKKIYKYGESLDLTGAAVEITLGSGAKTNINLPDGIVKISEYSPTATGEKQHMTVTVNETQAPETIDVEVYDYIKTVKLTEPNKTEYKYGEDLNLAGGKLTFTWASGKTTNQTILENMVTGYDKTQVKVQELTVKYEANYELSDGSSIKENFTETFEVEVVNSVETIEITPPNKTRYMHGESLDLSGGSIKVIYADQSTKTPSLTTEMIKQDDGLPVNMSPSSYDSTNKINKTLKIKYSEGDIEKTVDYPIEIINDIKSITMHSTPKTQYNVNDSLSLENGEILVTRATGEPEVIELTNENVEVTGFNSSVENDNLELTVKYTENEISKTTSYNISIEDTITSIKLLTGPTKTEYDYGQSLNLDGATIEVTRGSGKTTIPVTQEMVSEFNPNKLGKQELTVTYEGQVANEKIIVNVNDKVIGIKVTPPTKENYQKGEDLDLTGGIVTKIMASGEIGETVDLEEGMITTEFDSTKVGPQELTVSLEGFTDTFTVTVEDYITRIEIKEMPKNKYNYGEELGTPGGKINVVYQSGTEKEVIITPEMITDLDGTEFDTTDISFSPGETTATKQEKVTYEGFEATYEITITNELKEIRPQGEPKKDYVIGEEFEKNLSILVERANGEIEAIEVTEEMISGFDTSTEGKKQVTITYEENGIEKEYTYEINVTNPVTGMELEGTPKKDYLIGEDLDLSGLNIVLHKPGGDERIPVTEEMVSGYDKNTEGEQTVTITYEGQVVGSYKVNVANPIDRLEWIQKPKTSYIIGESLEVSGGQFKAIKLNAEEEIVQLTEEMVSDFDTKTEGKHIVTVTYKGKTLTYEINVSDRVNKIEITKEPKKEYKYGEELVESGEITATKASGETEVITITPDMITGYNKTQLGKKTVTITYGGQTVDFEITVVDYITNVVIVPPSKLEYEYGEKLDLSDSVIQVTKASTPDEPEVIQVTEDMISGYNPNNIEVQTVTITYTDEEETEHTKEFEVTVADKITRIEIKETPKNKYNYGEELGTPGGKINVVYQSGTEKEVIITPEMITDLDGTEFDTTDISFSPGETTATKQEKVTYEGFEATYEITITNELKEIRPQGEPKKDYVIGEGFEENLSILVERANGETEAIEVTEEMVSGFDTSTEGKKQVTITYEENGIEKEYTYEINVTNPITGMELEGEPKKDYVIGEELDLSGLNIVLHKPGGDERIPVTAEMASGYDKNTEGEQTVTITYEGQVVGSYKVNVANPIDRLEWVQKPKTSYIVGETLETTGGQFKAIKLNGEEVIIDLTDDMVSGFDTSEEGRKTLTVTYEEKILTYEINVSDRVNKIEITKEPKKEYKYGEELVEGGEITVTKASGETEVITITPDMITVYNKTQLGKQTVTITYGGQTVNFEITVVDYITNVVIVPPSKLEYEYGEELDLSDSVIKVIKASTPDKPEVIQVTEDMISGYDKNNAKVQTVTITYTDEEGKEYTKEFGVTVKDKIKSVTLNKENAKTNYKYGEQLDLSNLYLDITYESGKTQKIPVTTGMISGYNSNELGNQELTIEYQGFENKFEVIVVDYLLDIRLTPPEKSIYKIGESLSLKGGKVTEIMASGKEETAIQLIEDMVSGFDSTTPGTKRITVTYKKDEGIFTKYFEISVISSTSSIEVIAPNKTDYKYGESLDLTGGKIIIKKDDGTNEEKEITEDMVSGYNPKETGQQVVTVTYIDENNKQFTGSFIVNVGEDYVLNYEFTTPNKKEYKYGEELDLTGGKITEIMASGKTGKVVEITKDMVSGFDSKSIGKQVITVLYNGNKYNYNIVIKDEIKGISIKKYPDKLEYNKNETLDITGGILNVVKTSGIYEVKITKDMVSGFNSSKVGIQVITVTYEGFKTEFIVNVNETIIIPPDDGNNNTNNDNNKNESEISTKPEKPIKDESKDEIIEKPKDDEKEESKDENKNDENVDIPPVIGNIDDNNPPSNNSTDSFNEGYIRGIISGVIGLLSLLLIILLIYLYEKEKKNVKIYIEEGRERVLVGKEKISINNKNIDLNKYYDKYKEDEYKIVLSKAISKKLDNNIVNIKVHNKEEKFKVNYHNEKYEMNLKI